MLGFVEEVLMSPIARIVCEYAHELGTENTMTSSQTELNFLVAHQNEEHFMIGLKVLEKPYHGCFFQWHSKSCYTGSHSRPQAEIRCLIPLPNDQLAAGTSTGMILFYNCTKLEEIKNSLVSLHAVTALAVLSDNEIVFGTDRGEVGKIIHSVANAKDTNDTALVLFFDFAHAARITAIATLSNGNCVVGDVYGRLFWYNTQIGNKLFLERGVPTSVTALVVLASGKIVSSYLASALQVWDPDTAECLLTVANLHGIVMAMCVLQDGRLAKIGRAHV